MPAALLSERLADLVDLLLVAAALLVLLYRRTTLSWIVLLLAADPLWALGINLAGTAMSGWFGTVPALGLTVVPALQTVLADLPLWLAFVVGFGALFGSERGAVPRASGGDAQ